MYEMGSDGTLWEAETPGSVRKLAVLQYLADADITDPTQAFEVTLYDYNTSEILTKFYDTDDFEEDTITVMRYLDIME